MFSLAIKTDNAAFGEYAQDEVARILREAAYAVLARRQNGVLLDINGNTVGTFSFEQPE